MDSEIRLIEFRSFALGLTIVTRTNMTIVKYSIENITYKTPYPDPWGWQKVVQPLQRWAKMAIFIVRFKSPATVILHFILWNLKLKLHYMSSTK